MIRTGQQYLDSIRNTREVFINGERVKDVTKNPMMKPLIDIRARIYDMRNFDWDGPLQFVRKAADLSQRVLEKAG